MGQEIRKRMLSQHTPVRIAHQLALISPPHARALRHIPLCFCLGAGAVGAAGAEVRFQQLPLFRPLPHGVTERLSLPRAVACGAREPPLRLALSQAPGVHAHPHSVATSGAAMEAVVTAEEEPKSCGLQAAVRSEDQDLNPGPHPGKPSTSAMALSPTCKRGL